MRVDADDFARPCSCGETHQISAKEILIEPGAVDKLEAMMDEGCLKEYISPLLICDTHTYEATREPMEEIYDRCQVITLDADRLHTDPYALEVIRSNMEDDIDLILAVGGGTIHDLSRYVAFEQQIPFVSVPTAASVDGFASVVSAMNRDGIKKTLTAAGPVCVVADTNIFSKAPARLTASGASDLFGKYVSLADWKIAHTLTGEAFCKEVCRLQERALKEVRSCTKGLKEGDAQDCETLMYGLILSGLAMQMVGNSRPASGGEHHFAHLWEMEAINGPLDALHGEKVGVGTLICLREYKRIGRAIAEGRCRVIDYPGMEEELLEQAFEKKGLLEEIRRENTPDPLEEITKEELEECLPRIGEILEELPEVEEMKAMMEKAGCVVRLSEIGLEKETVEPSIRLSPYVRNRLSLMRLKKMLVMEGEEPKYGGEEWKL